MSGTALAQAMSLIVAPVLSRLYRPEDFGIFAMYLAVLTLAAPIVSVRYELAIVPAESDEDAFGLLLLSCAIAILVGLYFLLPSKSIGCCRLWDLVPWLIIPFPLLSEWY